MAEVLRADPDAWGSRERRRLPRPRIAAGGTARLRFDGRAVYDPVELQIDSIVGEMFRRIEGSVRRGGGHDGRQRLLRITGEGIIVDRGM